VRRRKFSLLAFGAAKDSRRIRNRRGSQVRSEQISASPHSADDLMIVGQAHVVVAARLNDKSAGNRSAAS
jgi:hypothetical protein